MNETGMIANLNIERSGLFNRIFLEGLSVSCNPGDSTKFIKVCRYDC
jgi:hypothetical protein